MRKFACHKQRAMGLSSVEIPIGHVSPDCIAFKEFPKLYLDQSITKWQLEIMSDDPLIHTAHRLRLCRSLATFYTPKHWQIGQCCGEGLNGIESCFRDVCISRQRDDEIIVWHCPSVNKWSILGISANTIETSIIAH